MKITHSDAPKGVIWYHDTACHKCGTVPVNSWDKRVSRTLGYKHIHCEACIAKEYDISVEELRAVMQEHYGLVPCQGL